MKYKIYTTGFHGKNVADLPVLLDKLDAVLADVRFSRDLNGIQWRGDYLNLLLKNRYRHLAAFGNRTENSGKISIHNFDLGLKIINSWNENVVLMCECETLENCHRAFLTGELKNRDFEIEELSDWKIEKFPF